MPPLADRDQFEAQIIADLAPVFRDQYERAVSTPQRIPYSQFRNQLQQVLTQDLADVYSAAGAALVTSIGIVVSKGAFRRNAESWSDQFASKLASEIVQTSRELSTESVANAGGDPQKLREALALVYLADRRLRNIAITEVTRATSVGEHAIVIPYNQAIGSGNSFTGQQSRLITPADPTDLANQTDVGQGDSDSGENEHETLHLRDELQENAEEAEAERARGHLAARSPKGVPFRRDDEGRKLIPIWRINPLSNVCRHCAPLNGHSREVWGQTYPMGPPGHPNCILPGNRVSFPGSVIAATKALYIGRCVEATLADGRKLAVTGNHPVLTDKGWIAAKFLHEGCNVFSAPNPDRVSHAVVPHNHDVPSPVENVFRAFVKAPSVASARMPCSAKDFHGDARFFNGQIDVVNKLRFLRGKNDISGDQHFAQGNLDCRNALHVSLVGIGPQSHFGNRVLSTASGGMCVVKHRRTLRSRSSRPSPLDGFRYSSGLNASVFQPQSKCSSRNAGFCGQRLLCLSTNVSVNERLEVRDLDSRAILDPQWSHIRSAAQRHSHLNEPVSQDVVINTDLARKFQNRFAGLITPQKIVNVRNFDWAGHVYDFQCDPYELYFCNGVIVHNCRCHIQWVAAADFARMAA